MTGKFSRINIWKILTSKKLTNAIDFIKTYDSESQGQEEAGRMQ